MTVIFFRPQCVNINGALIETNSMKYKMMNLKQRIPITRYKPMEQFTTTDTQV